MDATKWTQGFHEMINLKPMDQMISNNNNGQSTCITTATTTRQNNDFLVNTITVSGGGAGGGGASNRSTGAAAMAAIMERKAKPQEKLNCPRCNSTNTKFCYYNNYSLTQPRYFCKGCRRYWTEGGSLRNVPVGGSSRKNKRSSSSRILNSTSSSSSSLGLTTELPDLNPPILFSGQGHNSPGTTQRKTTSSQGLNLMSFPVMQDHAHHHNMNPQFLHMSKIENYTRPNPNCSSSSFYVSSSPVSALELLRTSCVSSTGFNSFITNSPMIDSNAALYSSGIPTMGNYRQPLTSLSFAGSTNENSCSDHDGANEQKGHHQGNSNTNAYWNGMFSTTRRPSW